MGRRTGCLIIGGLLTPLRMNDLFKPWKGVQRIPILSPNVPPDLVSGVCETKGSTRALGPGRKKKEMKREKEIALTVLSLSSTTRRKPI